MNQTRNNSTDRLPPYSIEAEQGMLGSILIDPVNAGMLRPDFFYDNRHRNIAQELIAMAEAGDPIDVITLVTRLCGKGKTEEVGGVAYVSALPDKTPSGANWVYFDKILVEKFLLRKAIQFSSDFLGRAYDPSQDVMVFLDDFERQALAIRDKATSDSDSSIREQAKEVVDELEACFQSRGKLRGLPSGLTDLDHLTGGFRGGQLIIIAARPGIGKTSLAMNIAEHCAVDNQIPTAVFSLEMSPKQLLFRMVCCRARVNGSKAIKGDLNESDFAKIATATSAIGKSKLHVMDSCGLTLGKLAATARRLAQRVGIKLLIIDYLQLMRASERRMDSRVAEITAISGGLKSLAVELDIPVIALAQLNREADKEGRRPRPSDLRDSGSIEQDADLIMMLHAASEDSEMSDESQSMELLIPKHRNGRIGKIDLIFIKPYTRFESAAKASPEGYAEPHND